MRRLGEWVLGHRKLVLVGWLLVTIAGMSVVSSVNDRLTVDFSLPGQPGTETASKIIEAYGNGGNTVPFLVTVTMPEGQSVTGNEQQIGDAFASVTQADVPLRVLDEANTGDDAFRTDERAHRDAALAAGAERAPAYPLLSGAIRLGCRVAIRLSERI